MPKTIDRDRVRELTTGGAQLVEVLPEAEYEERHLPGALSIPLERIDTDAAKRLDKAQGRRRYCWDSA